MQHAYKIQTQVLLNNLINVQIFKCLHLVRVALSEN